MLIKCNTFPSTGYAYLARKYYPRLAVYGGIVINHQIGGLNPVAVDSAVKYGEGVAGKYCRFVCLPTFAAVNDVMFHKRDYAPICCVNDKGKIYDDLKRIFDIIVRTNQILLLGAS